MLIQSDSPRKYAPDKVMQQVNCLRYMTLTSTNPPHTQVYLFPYLHSFDL